MLCEFFNAMVSSIRLFRLKRLPATLSKLSRNIEFLTDRRFTLHHLAQLKNIVPDIIAVKKIRVQDEETGCMKEELVVSLQVNASGGYSQLKRVFHSRIIDYAMTHPESDDVPEGELPELFYNPKQESERSVNQSTVLPVTTSVGPSFKRRFSSRTLRGPVSELSPAAPLPETPSHETAKFESTPVKFVSTPARLMSETTASRRSKRSHVADDGVSDLPFKSAKRRSLKFEEHGDDDKEIDVQVRYSAVSKDLLSLMEKEQRILEEQKPIVLKARKRQQLMAGVAKTL